MPCFSACLGLFCSNAAPSRRLILTGSGGPFRTWDVNAIANAPQQACLHPNWSMGQKISVDQRR